jgi:hypothetical protein
MNEVRQIVLAYAGQSLVGDANVLNVQLTGVLPRDLDAPTNFNKMSPAQRVTAARAALASAGVAGLAPLAQVRADRWGRGIALDAETWKPVCSHDGIFGHICGPSGIAKDSGSRAGRLHRALDRVLDELERKGRRRRPESDRDNRVAAADARRMNRRDQQTRTAVRDTRAYGERAMGTQAVNDELRRLAGLDAAGDGGDAAYFARAAAATCGWGA